jgi:catechol 2,3-dioxygenase-like lactoylglutathione lyase family enzyme
MKIQFVAGVTPITSNPAASAGLYLDALGLPLGGEQRYLSTDSLEGVKHFGVWPIEAAAQSCFGQDTWPDHIPVPQATIEFELEDVAAVGAATEELAGKGFEIIHGAKEEPWGQTIARFLSPEGLLIGLSYAPWMHEDQA